jgi:hypothetical protein
VDLRFDQPIAQRTLTGRHGAVVEVMIGAPRPFDDHTQRTGWYCPFRVEDIDGQPWINYAGGMDGVQALVLALVRIGEYLSSRTDLELTLDGSKDLGFLSAKMLSGAADQ